MATAACEFDSKSLNVLMDVKVNAEPRSIEPVVECVLDIAEKMECAKGKELEIETSLREALANAIVHGCEENPDMLVQCCVACDPAQGMLIVVRHYGKGFDPEQIPSPVVGENVFRSHGRGIYLINQLMDHVEYHRGGTEIRMRKR